MIAGGNKIKRSDKETAKVLNEFFSNALTNLNIPQFNQIDRKSENINNSVIKGIVKYRAHPSIIAFKENCTSKSNFNFSFVEKVDILKEIKMLQSNKATQNTDIPTKLIKDNADIFAEFIFISLNKCIEQSVFPSKLKLANITPVHKKNSKSSKENYRPVSILSNISKVYEKFMFKQMSEYFESFLSKYQCGFRKGYSAQHCLLSMLEKWKSAIDNKKMFGALLTDLSKAFDCLSHDLLIAKLNAYGFSIAALRLVQNYLSNRKQRTKINSDFSSWEEILFGVPQGSILGPLLFNIFLCDLFFIMNETDFASYADDNTPYVVGNNIEDVIIKLQNASLTLFQWFYDNQMKANPDKCHFICSTDDKVNITVENQKICNSPCEKLLGVRFDSKLTFDAHINDICKKAGLKLNALARITPYMDLNKKRLLLNAFFMSQFNYCQLVWMCHNRTKNNKINRLHERCLRLIYNDKKSSFEQLLEIDSSVSVHDRNLRALATEMYKIYHGISPTIMNEIFTLRHQNQYNLRNWTYFDAPKVRTVNHGSESVRYFGSKIWEIIPAYTKKLVALTNLKLLLKNGNKDLVHVGYVESICKI